MKTKLPLIAAIYCGLCTAGSAFTLDFVGYLGTSVPPTLTIPVAGYGNVSFTAAPGKTLVVDEAHKDEDGFGAPSLSFDEGDTVIVTFDGDEPLNVFYSFVGVSNGEIFTNQDNPAGGQSDILTLSGSGDGAGLYKISWQTQPIPEPSSSLLGVLGMSLLIFRRRR